MDLQQIICVAGIRSKYFTLSELSAKSILEIMLYIDGEATGYFFSKFSRTDKSIDLILISIETIVSL